MTFGYHKHVLCVYAPCTPHHQSKFEWITYYTACHCLQNIGNSNSISVCIHIWGKLNRRQQVAFLYFVPSRLQKCMCGSWDWVVFECDLILFCSSVINLVQVYNDEMLHDVTMEYLWKIKCFLRVFCAHVYVYDARYKKSKGMYMIYIWNWLTFLVLNSKCSGITRGIPWLLIQYYYTSRMNFSLPFAWKRLNYLRHSMMTSSNWNFFRVIGHVGVEFSGDWSVTRSFDVFFDLRLNKRLSWRPWG